MPRISAARAASRRRQIVDAALACFARNGFHKTTMQDVVKQSGLSPGAIYCHFAGKHDIILAVVAERHRREADLLRRAAAEASLDAGLERLLGDFIAALATPAERSWRRLAIQLWAESLHDRPLLGEVRRGVETPRRLLAAIIEAARAQGDLPSGLDPAAAARVLIACFQGLALQQSWEPGLDLAACADALRLLLRIDGLSMRASAPAAKAGQARERRRRARPL
jgi:TetR/AcrR family transcriptional regulator, transcriptional repressor of aconitase